MDVEKLDMTDDEIVAEASWIRTEGRPNHFEAGARSPEEVAAILLKADDIAKANASAIGSAA